QYNRGSWCKDPQILKQGDMIEIQLGQGAIAGVSHYAPASSLPQKLRKQLKIPQHKDLIVKAFHHELKEKDGLSKLVNRLREITGGVPIGVKLAFNNSIEREIDIAVDAGVDVLALEGTQAATKGAAPILEDDFGLPTIIGLCRAVEH